MISIIVNLLVAVTICLVFARSILRWVSEMTSGIFNDVAQFEHCLGLPNGFYGQLLKEEDWSFVVKLSALFEAACAHILMKRLHTPELEDEIAHLDYGNS